MKTRAAIAMAPGKPLVIEEVELAGPRAIRHCTGCSIRAVVEL